VHHLEFSKQNQKMVLELKKKKINTHNMEKPEIKNGKKKTIFIIPKLTQK
jgi:hypothetical protein